MGVALVVAVLLLLLAVPIGAVFRLEGIEPCEGEIRIDWLFGLVRFRLRVPGSRAHARMPEATPSVAKTYRKRGRHRTRTNLLAVLRQAAFRRRVYRLLQDILAAAHLRRFTLRIRLGLDDPADTGRLWIWIGPFYAWAQSLRHVNVWIEPDFLDAVFQIRARGKMSFVPLQMLFLIVKFTLSPDSIRAWRALRETHA